MFKYTLIILFAMILNGCSLLWSPDYLPLEVVPNVVHGSLV
jgi:PBP1b-binding outer membrane lipoprotein LpoB